MANIIVIWMNITSCQPLPHTSARQVLVDSQHLARMLSSTKDRKHLNTKRTPLTVDRYRIVLIEKMHGILNSVHGAANQGNRSR